MAQITTRLTKRERRSFEKYALSMGLNGSALARLLIARHLGTAIKGGRTSKKGRGRDEGKLTAHFHGSGIVREFKASARQHQMSEAEAAKRLFKDELCHQSVMKALGLDDKQVARPKAGPAR